MESQTIPLRRVWQILGLCESVQYAIRLVTWHAERQGEVDFSPREQNGLDVVACVKQARGYFEAAEAASIAVSPLLLFYGVSSLAKAVVVARSPEYHLGNMGRHHGLSASQIAQKNVGKAGLTRELMKFEASVEGGGTFLEYAETLSGSFAYKVFDETTGRSNTLKVDAAPATSLPGRKFSLGDLLARQPAIRSLYHHAVGSRPLNHYGVSSMRFDGGVTLCNAHFKNDPPAKDLEGHIRSHFPQVATCLVANSPTGSIIGLLDSECLTFASPQAVPMFPLSADLGMRGSASTSAGYFVAPFEFGTVSEALQLYVLSYLLGMLARYYPTVWMKLIASGGSDEAFPLCRSAVDLIRERFPVLALEGLASFAHERTFVTS